MNSWKSFKDHAGLILGVVAFGILMWIDFGPTPHVKAAAAVAILMAIWWITEAVPLAATALLPVFLFPITGVAPVGDVAPRYINSTIFLFLGGFLLALAMARWNLHRRIAYRIILLFGSRPRRLVLGFMIAAAILSMWVSNTATAVMMLPMAMAILDRMSEANAEKAKRIAPFLLLGLAYACSIGGVATLIGTPPNLILARLARDLNGVELSFGEWMKIGLPFATIMLGIVWFLLGYVLFRVDGAELLSIGLIRSEFDKLGKVTREEIVVMIVFTITALLWIFRSPIALGSLIIPGWSGLLETAAGIDDGVVAIAMSTFLFVIPAGRIPPGTTREKPGRILDADVFASIPWSIILLFGGGFALAAGFESSGLAAYLAQSFSVLDGVNTLVMIVFIAAFMTFLTEFTSNTASTQLVLPLLATAATAQNIDPMLLMLPATLAASMAFMMPVATPPNAIVFGSGRLRVIEMARTGFLLNLVSITVISIAVYLYS